jgi:hypothetical protein
MDTKYVLFIPQGGINDCFCGIVRTISYCKMNNRTLLLDFTNSAYNINFSDYFDIKELDCSIIYNSNEIKNIISSLKNSNCLTVHPNNLDFNLIDLFDKTKKFNYKWHHDNSYSVNNIPLDLPINAEENVILYLYGLGADGIIFFKNLLLCENIKNIINKKLTILKENYLCIQVRNTDRKCDYKNLYENNKEYIHNFDQVYICTDDKHAYDFFKSEKMNVLCFTTFPENTYRNLHDTKEILPSTKMEDLLTDIFIATNSKSILSNSKGGFIRLLQHCHKNKKYIMNMLS